MLLLLYLENQYSLETGIGLCIHEQKSENKLFKINIISIPGTYCICNLMCTVHIVKNNNLQRWKCMWKSVR